MTVATTSTDECNASEISARLPIRMPTTNLAIAMPALAKIEIAATDDLTVLWVALMSGGVAAQPLTSSAVSDRNRHSLAAGVLQVRFVANYSQSKSRHCEPTGRAFARPVGSQ